MFIIVFIEENFKNLEKNTQNSKYQTSKVCDLSAPSGQLNKVVSQETRILYKWCNISHLYKTFLKIINLKKVSTFESL